MSIFVERIIDADRRRLWMLTQTPELHQRWDLRFSEIHYLPRESETDPQAFEYETRLGFGLSIRGTGQTAGEHRAENGASSSALTFGSNARLSLIRKGSGYWRYTPVSGAEGGQTRFATAYDYVVRWGKAGWLLDRLIFRPLMAWATAWSFERLARWAAQGTTPETSARVTLAYTLARLTLVGMWLFEGLVPKLLGPHPQELRMSGALAGADGAATLAMFIGVAELGLGLLMLVLWRRRWPLVVTALAMVPATIAGAYAAPELITATISVVLFNVLAAAMAVVALILQPDVVSAAACEWRVYRQGSLTRIFGN